MRILLAVGGGLAAAVIGITSWFAIDEAITEDEVAPNVIFDGMAMRRLSLNELDDIVDSRAREILDAPIVVQTPAGFIETTAAELGVEVDRTATFDAVAEAGRTGSFLSRLWSWARAPWTPRVVESTVGWSPERIATRLLDHDGVVVSEPVEPQVDVTEDAIRVIRGLDGIMVDTEATASLIHERLVPGVSLDVVAELSTTEPADTDEAAEALADRLEDMTGGGLTVRVLGAVGRLSEPTLRAALQVVGPVSDPEISIRQDLLQEALLDLFSTLSRPGTDPVFDVVDGVPELVEAGSPPRGCCGTRSTEVIVQAMQSGASEPVDLPAAVVGDPELEAWARGEGIVEVVGEFTTAHNCCESRVANIHRIADLIRGQYLLPGETFSVNEFVGERTVEKGFVGAGVIEQGRFTEDVGGGISQFATTFFNAAFFAGLDIDEYQSHSIYISRYPYGREATLSYPKPDLVVTNATEYPVLIWPTYSDTTITVSIYSTDHLVVEETGQEEGPARQCTQVETFRSKTYPDGTVVEDSFLALYRPAEGIDCDGNPTPEP